MAHPAIDVAVDAALLAATGRWQNGQAAASSSCACRLNVMVGFQLRSILVS
jgi:hypothetical protein